MRVIGKIDFCGFGNKNKFFYTSDVRLYWGYFNSETICLWIK